MKKILSQSFRKGILNFCKYFFVSLGILFTLLISISLTDIPYNAYHYLGTNGARLKQKPDMIILLGGSGMPSADGLIRTYYTALAAKKFPLAQIIIALPSNENDSLYQLKLMARELIMKGIDSSRIIYEPNGFNTRSQALNIANKFSLQKNKLNILIITSPEHMYRSIKTFRKAGFPNTGGIASFEKPPDEEKIKDKQKTKDLRIKNLALRYNIWSYLNYEILVAREYCALIYYWSKNWI
jgi:uncharacterized SAM-binding protein YcdF (DUF218 family)